MLAIARCEAATDPQVVMIFSPETQPVTVSGEHLTLQHDSSHGSTLPPQLILRHDVISPTGNSVIAVYRALGPRVDAQSIPGTSKAPPIPGGVPRHYRLVVLSNPTEGQERAYNDWYDHQHVPDVLRVPGFLTAQRLQRIRTLPQQWHLPSYAVIFEFDSFDLEATIADVRHRLATGVTRASPAFDVATSINRYYEVIP